MLQMMREIAILREEEKVSKTTSSFLIPSVRGIQQDIICVTLYYPISIPPGTENYQQSNKISLFQIHFTSNTHLLSTSP